MLRVAGILRQKCAGKFFAFTAVKLFFLLTADRDRAFPVEGMSVCSNAAAAGKRLFEAAALTTQSAAGIDGVGHGIHSFFLIV